MTLSPRFTPLPPNGEALALLAALSNPANHERHTAALTARDNALSSSSGSYSTVVVNMARILNCPSISQLPQEELMRFQLADPTSVMQLQHDPTSWAYLRCMAGLLLKNALLRPPRLPPHELDPNEAPQRQFMTVSQEYVTEIQSILLQCLTDPTDAQIRKITSSIIASCAGSTEAANILSVYQWPELIPHLMECLNGSYHGEIGVKAALDTLVKFCEDVPTLLDSESCRRPINQLVPIWISYLDLPEAIYREKALRCLNCFIDSMPSALVLQFDSYLQGLSRLATDADPQIRILVCRAIVNLASMRMEYISPHFQSIVSFMVHATADSNPDVALEACEFWLTFAAMDEEECSSEMMRIVQDVMPQLVPILVSSMVYPDDKKEELLEENKRDEVDVEDRGQDIAPVFHKSRSAHGGGSVEEEDDEDEDDAGGTGGDDSLEWSLRKCAAASLDTLASMFGPGVILPSLLPALQQGLNHADPWVREASILALGAIAEGCEEAMAEHMPTLHPYLVQQLSPSSTGEQTLPQVKSIACWTLGRYASWMVEQVETGVQPELTKNLCEMSVQLMLDRNKKVQVAACSAFGVYVENFADYMVPYLEPLFGHLVKAIQTYKARSFMVLCDTLGVMADVIGEPLGEGNIPHIFLPTLVEVWIRHPNQLDRMLLPLMECLACMSLALRHNFQPWAYIVFEKCMSTIETCRLSLAATADNGENEKPRDEESDFIICGVDLLDGMVEGLGSSFETLVKSNAKFADSFLATVHALCRTDAAGVRMSAFALVGDLARNAPALIEPGIPQLMQEVVECIDPTHPSVCNNATWAAGEICVRCERDRAYILAPLVDNLLGKLIPLLMGNQGPDGSFSCSVAIPGLAENASTTMGRLARLDPSFVKADLPRFVSGWCEGLARVADMRERIEAFEGLIVAVHANPHAILSAPNRAATVAAFVFAIVSWHIPTGESGTKTITSELLHGPYAFDGFPLEVAELGQALGQLLTQIKNALGPEWDDVARMPVNVRRLLAEVYGV